MARQSGKSDGRDRKIRCLDAFRCRIRGKRAENDELLRWFNDHGFVRTARQVETHLETNKIYVYRFDRVPANMPRFSRGARVPTLAGKRHVEHYFEAMK